jgi:hypothetical protein
VSPVSIAPASTAMAGIVIIENIAAARAADLVILLLNNHITFGIAGFI